MLVIALKDLDRCLLDGKTRNMTKIVLRDNGPPGGPNHDHWNLWTCFIKKVMLVKRIEMETFQIKEEQRLSVRHSLAKT